MILINDSDNGYFLFLGVLETKSVELGAFDRWIKLSDHVPVIVEVKPHFPKSFHRYRMTLGSVVC